MRQSLCHVAQLTALLAALAAPAPLLAQAGAGVVINEVAWMGSTSDALDEWIELYNDSAAPVDLTGWTLWEGTKDHALSGTIPAGGYFLIERRETATSVPADLIAAISLANGGEELSLTHSAGHPVDFVTTSAGWFAGSNEAPKATMERVTPGADGTQATSWVSNDGRTQNGTDSGGLPVHGTPKQLNSAGVDSLAPTLRGVLWRDAETLVLVFDEPLSEASAQAPGNFSVAGATPVSATQDPAVPTQVVLTVSGLDAGMIVRVVVNGVTDAAGNVVTAEADTYAGPLALGRVQEDDPATAEPTLQADTFLTVEGWVGAAVYSEHEVNLYDLSGGVSVYDADLRAWAMVGARLRVAGVINFFNGKTEIGTGAGSTLAEPLASAGEPPVLVLDGAAWLSDPEGWEGRLVAVRDLSRAGGTWPVAGNANLPFQDPTGHEVIVRIDEDTDLSGAAEPQWPRTVQGIAGQFDATVPYTEGHQVIPRSTADLLSAPPCACAIDTLSAYWCRPLAGTCTLVACADGLGDCDGEAANGCEADVATDDANCGACDNACRSTELCRAGACVPRCPDADGDGWPAAECGGSDCDDTNPDVHPNALEVCGNGIDEDCVNGDLACPEPDGGTPEDGGTDPESDGGSDAADGGVTADGGDPAPGTPSTGCGCAVGNGGGAGGAGGVGGAGGAGGAGTWLLVLAMGLVGVRRVRRRHRPGW